MMKLNKVLHTAVLAIVFSFSFYNLRFAYADDYKPTKSNSECSDSKNETATTQTQVDDSNKEPKRPFRAIGALENKF